jgi:hypothetical protein
MAAKLINVTSQAVLQCENFPFAIVLIKDAPGQKSSSLQALACAPFLSVN